MRLMTGSGSGSGSGSALGSDEGGRFVMGTYMWSTEGWMEGGRRGLRRERRKQGSCVKVVGFVGWANWAHDTRNMLAE